VPEKSSPAPSRRQALQLGVATVGGVALAMSSSAGAEELSGYKLVDIFRVNLPLAAPCLRCPFDFVAFLTLYARFLFSLAPPVHVQECKDLGTVRFLSVNPYGAVLEALGKLDYALVPFEIPMGKSKGQYVRIAGPNAEASSLLPKEYAIMP
jgi:hypothetical protein